MVSLQPYDNCVTTQFQILIQVDVFGCNSTRVRHRESRRPRPRSSANSGVHLCPQNHTLPENVLLHFFLTPRARFARCTRTYVQHLLLLLLWHRSRSGRRVVVIIVIRRRTASTDDALSLFQSVGSGSDARVYHSSTVTMNYEPMGSGCPASQRRKGICG